ncbi:hypothetical protein PCC6912_50910 [Chlorogloeopsis fritschii PCC 6912]|uniref:Uncharacterized protein n=1 Tax=Chlorogloeopsis fritschii PCC 6912 TaxID=211165 RepID=A0A3S0XPW0_CHLFR|nr:hypothetical protein [Chlorogloeopsis fritschii]RUR74913.1 hypothetical protein PCC6912_50910 [Chlorogloeopsis fritschii PCC 6912]
MIEPNENYWDNYNPDTDFQSLTPVDRRSQSVVGSGNIKVQNAGYDPMWVFTEFGDRLRLLPADLYDSVFEAIKGGTTNPMLAMYINTYSGGATLNSLWEQEAKRYLPDLK